MASTVLPNGIIIPEKFSRDWYADLYHNWQELDNLLGGGGGGANDGTLTIQKNGATVTTFSANQATDATANIEVPTKTSDLTNDSDFVQSSDLATVATSGSYNDLSNKPTIPTVNNATLTIQQNGTTVDTFTANASVDKTININTADDTKIPLAGSNQISGDLIPSTDNSIDIGSSTKNIKMLYTKGITIDGTQFSPSDYVLPTGSYIQFAGSQAPAGFLVCNGGAISRTTYSALFAVIGTTYGSGDGSTTFNLPNLTDRFLQGSGTSGTVRNAGLPNITGEFGKFRLADSYPTAVGAFNLDAGLDRNVANSSEAVAPKDIFTFSASRSSSIYGNSTTVQPPALTCLICIKY